MDLKELKALLRLMEGNDVEELEVEEGGRRVRIRRRSAVAAIVPAGPVPAAASRSAAAPVATAVAATAPETAGLIPVESPMVGTFYRAPAPGADPYVKEGDPVEKGSVLCIIEAMKLMNEIEAEVRGRLVKILVENGQPVEFGQTLFLLEPA
jgi:acetyl-CoA carboxylase biotin carboxyl carrier protein